MGQGNGEKEVRDVACPDCGCNLWRDEGDGYRFEKWFCVGCGYEEPDEYPPPTTGEATDRMERPLKILRDGIRECLEGNRQEQMQCALDWLVDEIRAAWEILRTAPEREANAMRLLNNWLAWYEQGGGSLGALEQETRAALSQQDAVTYRGLSDASLEGLSGHIREWEESQEGE